MRISTSSAGYPEQQDLQGYPEIIKDQYTTDSTWGVAADFASFGEKDVERTKDKDMDKNALYGDDWNVVVSTDRLDTIQRILRTEETTAADETSVIAGESSLKSAPEDNSISGSESVLPRTLSFISLLHVLLLV